MYLDTVSRFSFSWRWLRSNHNGMNFSDFKIFKISLFAQGACYYFGIRGVSERDAEEERSRWVLDISRIMRLVTQSLFPIFRISCDPIKHVELSESRLMAGYLVHYDDCFTASVLYCELHVNTQDHSRFIFYEDETCTHQLSEIYVTERSICCEKIGNLSKGEGQRVVAPLAICHDCLFWGEE